MRFLIDNSVSPRLGTILSEAGHDAVHVRDLGMASAEDAIIFRRAQQDDRILIAQDTDFGTLLATRRETKPSLLLLRRATKSSQRIGEVLTANLSRLEVDLHAGCVAVIEESRIRIRRLPIVSPSPQDQ